MKGAELFVQSLKGLGVKFVFGLPDTTLLGMLDALHGENAIRYLSVRHEQVASMMADGYARAAMRPGVCMSQCGAGAMNLLYGVTSAYKDSVPVIALTGNINSKLIGRDTWHDIPLHSLFGPVTKWTTTVTNAAEIPETLDHAFHVAMSGRPGPVHVNFPIDVQLAEIDAGQSAPASAAAPGKPLQPVQADIDRAVQALAQAERPVIFAGSGVAWANGADALVKFSELSGIPVIATDNGRGVIPEDHQNALGPAGHFGSVAAGNALKAADVIFGVGTRFPDINTAVWTNISPSATVIQNNIDPGEIGRHVTAAIGIPADARACLEAMLDRWQALGLKPRAERAARTAALKQEVDAELAKSFATPPGQHERIPVQDMVRELAGMLPEDAIVTMDGGLFQMCAAKMPVRRPRSYLSSAGLGAMGYGLPAAMGAKLAQPDRPVIAVAGDGGIAMVSQDLETAVRGGIPVVIVVYNNNAFGAIRMHQLRTYGGRLMGTTHTNPDYAELAKLYGAEGRTVRKISEFRPALEALLKSGRVGLIDVQGQ